MTVRVDLNISLDGVAMPADPSPENPMGADRGRLIEDYVATRTFRERIFGDTSGAGTTGVDDRYGAAYSEGVGAEVMGAGMFGLHAYPDDADWCGWLGRRADVRIGGGVSVVRDALAADLVDRLHVAVRPVVLGRGTRLWDDLRDLDRRFVVTSEVAESGVVHVTFAR